MLIDSAYARPNASQSLRLEQHLGRVELAMNLVRCPKCGLVVRMGDGEWPLTCACLARYASAAEMQQVKRGKTHKRRNRRTVVVDPKHGPGADLKALLASIGFIDWAGCGCDAKAQKMNVWGVSGCRDNRSAIVGWLNEAARKVSFFTKAANFAKASAIIPAAHWNDPIPWLVDEAILRAAAAAERQFPVRNLLYHVAPLRANDLWLQNVRQLRRRMDIFTGRRIVAIAVGEGMLPSEEVEAAFAEYGCEFLRIPNCPELREVKTFLPLLEAIGNQEADQATFYAHTKGNSTACSVEGARRWRNLMYHRLLDDWQSCLSRLTEFPMVGTHFMHWDGRSPFPSRIANRHGWMFAGTFFWFRHDRVFKSPHWREVPRDRYAAEAWPGQMFRPEEANSVWPTDGRNLMGVNPYDPKLYAAEEIPDDA